MLEDARLHELNFLTRLEREGLMVLTSATDPRDARIAIHLLEQGIVNDAGVVPSYHTNEIAHHRSIVGQRLLHYSERLFYERWETIAIIQGRQQLAEIRATHASAVRRAELAASIRKDRLRDAMGIIFDGRFAVRDLQIALYSASSDAPVAVAFVDMNGLKQLNDDNDHALGDIAASLVGRLRVRCRSTSTAPS